MKQSCFWNVEFNDIVNDATRWLSILIYIYINIYYTMISFRYHEDISLIILMPYNGYIYMMSRWHGFLNNFYGDDYVVLRASMDDLWQRSHMGRCYFHSTEAVWELTAREEWLGCRHDVAHVGHTRVNTSVGSLYTVFWIFIF